jgi:hypothetical protein
VDLRQNIGHYSNHEVYKYETGVEITAYFNTETPVNKHHVLFVNVEVHEDFKAASITSLGAKWSSQNYCCLRCDDA